METDQTEVSSPMTAESLTFDHRLRLEMGQAIEAAVAGSRRELERALAEESAQRMAADAEALVRLEQIRLEAVTAKHSAKTDGATQNSWEKIQEAFQIGHAELNDLRDLLTKETSARGDSEGSFQRQLDTLEAKVERGALELLRLKKDMEEAIGLRPFRQVVQRIDEKVDEQQQRERQHDVAKPGEKLQAFVGEICKIDLDGRIDHVCDDAHNHKTILDERLSGMQAAIVGLAARMAIVEMAIGEEPSRSSSVPSPMKIFRAQAPEGATVGQCSMGVAATPVSCTMPASDATKKPSMEPLAARTEQVRHAEKSSALPGASSSPVLFSLEARLASMETTARHLPARIGRSSAVASLAKTFNARAPEGKASRQGSKGLSATPAPCMTPMSDCPTEPYAENVAPNPEQEHHLERSSSPLKAASSLRTSSRDAELAQDAVHRLAACGPCNAPVLASGVHASPRYNSPALTRVRSAGLLPSARLGSHTPDPSAFRRTEMPSAFVPQPIATAVNVQLQHRSLARPQTHRTTSSREGSHTVKELSPSPTARIILAGAGISKVRTASSPEPHPSLLLAYPTSVVRTSSGSPMARVDGASHCRSGGDPPLGIFAQQSSHRVLGPCNLSSSKG